MGEYGFGVVGAGVIGAFHAAAIAMVPGARTGSHDTTDPSYDRPLTARRPVPNLVDQLSAQP